MDIPKISVIIPVYNTVNYLERCIESVLKQTLKDFEIICIDDGSNDGSYELLHNYAAIDKRIKVFRNKEKGVAHARYQGCSMAKAAYIQFLDSDDWLDEKALETVYRQYLLNDYDICSFRYYNYDENEKKILSITSGIEEACLPVKNVFNYNDCKEKIFQLIAPNVWSKTYKKDFIQKFLKMVIGFNGSEDMFISCYSSLFAKRIIFIKEPLYYYRRNRLNSLQTSKDLQPLKFYNAYKLFCKLITEHYDYENLKISYMNRALRGCIYDLLSKKTEEGYYITYKFLKEKGLQELKILGYPKSYYYNKNDYILMKCIVDYPYMFSKSDLFIIANNKINSNNKDEILNKYKFKYKLEIAKKEVRYEIVFDKRKLNFIPYVSIILPIYNTALYLKKCLDSLKKQSLENIEIICVDDGSTDDSLHILKKYVRDDNRFVVLVQENFGQSVARNTGVKLARGKYLYFCDSDDILRENALEKLYIKAEKEKLDMVFFNTDVYFQNKNLIDLNKTKYYERKNNYEGVWNGKNLMKAMVENNEYLVSPCLSIINSEYFHKNNLWFANGVIHEDNIYTFKAMYAAERVGFLSDKFYIRRVRINSVMTSNKSFANVYGYFYCVLEILEFLKTKTIYNENVELSKNILNKLIRSSNKIYNELHIKEKETKYLLSGYEQILFDNLIINYDIKNRYDDSKHDIKTQKALNVNKMNNEYVKEKTDLNEIKKELIRTKKQLEDIKAGYSFRIGRIITFIPRKIKGGIKCFKEHGIKYTAKRIGQKLKIFK